MVYKAPRLYYCFFTNSRKKFSLKATDKASQKILHQYLFKVATIQ